VRLDGDEMPADADDGDAQSLFRNVHGHLFDIRRGKRHHRVMATNVRPPRGPGSTLGYAIVLLGAGLFVTSCFLPYNGFEVLGERTISLYQQLMLGPNDSSSDLGALLYLFGGVAPVAVVATVGLVRGEGRAGLPSLLVGAAAAWSLTWIGVLLRLGTFAGASWEVGFWLQAVSIGVAVIGTILVATRRTGAHERGAAGLGV
jgi:hypothetical protein